MRRGSWARVAVVASGIAVTSCIDITVDSRAIGSIEFPPFPWTAIEAGDTLRDTTGKAVPLTARVFRADGSVDSTVPITFLTFDTLLTPVSAAKYILGKSLDFRATPSFTARVAATTGTVQSQSRTLAVVPAVKAVGLSSPTAPVQDTINYNLPAAATDTSMALTVKVTGLAGASPVAVPSWLVRYSIRSMAGQALPATDTTLAFFLINDAGRVSTVDTTDVSGTATRRLRFRIRQGQKSVDTVRVLAKVGRGSRIPAGDTTSWLVVVRPK